MKESLEAPICARADDLMTWLYGESNDQETRSIEQHLESCPQCSQDALAFRGIRQSMTAWRDETLGQSSPQAISAAPKVTETRNRSAVAAIQEFLNLSPLWLKGAVAFGAVVVCLVTIIAITKLREQPQTLATNGQIYSAQDLQSLVDKRAKEMAEQMRANEISKSTPKPDVPSLDERPQPVTRNRQAESTNTVAQSGSGRRAPLTKYERAQLAADLRLISEQEDSDVDLFGEGGNRREQQER